MEGISGYYCLRILHMHTFNFDLTHSYFLPSDSFVVFPTTILFLLHVLFCFAFNPLSPLNAAGMYMGVRPSTGTWRGSQRS